MATAHVRESVVEKHLVQACSDQGLLCLKVKAIATAGIPDRLVIGHDHRGDPVLVFVEVKRPGAKPRPAQVHRIKDLRDHGAHAVVVSTIDEVDRFLADYVTDSVVPIADRDPCDAPLPGASTSVVIPRL